MYLSILTINTGTNPDRPRPGRFWLKNRYHVHQRLCMAFPSASRKAKDVDFLKPFRPDEFDNGQVRVQRAPDRGFLFRIDPLANGRAVIIVQSAVEPDWDYAFHNARHFLAAFPEIKPFDPSFQLEQRLRFRLLANPTKKIETIKKAERKAIRKEDLKDRKGRHGKRVPVPTAAEISAWRENHPSEDVRTFVHDRLLEWLRNWRPGENGSPVESSGFAVDTAATTVQPGYVYMNKEGKGQGQRLRSVLYDGILTVKDPLCLRKTLVAGIGSGKAFGFGLLSVVPANA